MFLLQCFERGIFFILVHARPRRLLQHGENLFRFHVEHFCDATLHDEEMRVVHVELHRVEKILHARRLRYVAVDHVLVAPANDDLYILKMVGNVSELYMQRRVVGGKSHADANVPRNTRAQKDNIHRCEWE